MTTEFTPGSHPTGVLENLTLVGMADPQAMRYRRVVIHHLFTARLVAEGKIKLLRASLNVVAAAQALKPNGAADLPPPEREIFLVPPDYVS